MEAEGQSARVTIRLAVGAVFAALVCAATVVFVINVPATTGYFNIGETVIYVAALLFGPIVGAFAGGIGATIADMIVAPVFAPATIIVKGLEGAIVGFLNKRVLLGTPKSNWRIYTILLGVILGLLLAVTGPIAITGQVEVYLGFPTPASPTFTGYVAPEIWYFLGAIAALLIIIIGFRIEPELGRSIFSVIIGGLEMVAGYFLYEQLILNTAAIAEIPINIGQMLIGLIVAIPIVKVVQRSLPQLKR